MLHSPLSDTLSLMSASASGEGSFEMPDEATLPTSEAGDRAQEGVMSEERSFAVSPVALVRFRKAYLEVSDAEDFRAGIICGQATLAGKQQGLTDEYLFALFEDLFRDLEMSRTRLVGCVFGMVDAVLHARKTLPPEFAALLSPLK